MEKQQFFNKIDQYAYYLIEKYLNNNHEFFKELHLGTATTVSIEKLLVEYAHFYDHIFDFLSPSLSWQQEYEFAKKISNWYVKTLANLRPEYIENRIVELGIQDFKLKQDASSPANNAIKNQMLLLGLNHTYAFIACLPHCFAGAWQMDRVIASLKGNEKYHRYIEPFEKIHKYLADVQHCYQWISDGTQLNERDEFFIKKQLQLLIEKFDKLFVDVHGSSSALEVLHSPQILHSNGKGIVYA